jgi:transcription initiation factor TFIID subunit 5
MEEHGLEIERLSGITDPLHIKENELAQNFLGNKFGVRMCKYSFELLLCFLQDKKYMLLLRLMNQFIKIEGHFSFTKRLRTSLAS